MLGLMNKTTLIIFVAIVFAITLAAFISVAGGDGGSKFYSISVFTICASIAFIINWLAFIPANIAKSERYYDLIGSLTYLTIVVLAVVLSSNIDARAIVVSSLVIIWALRLGSFLFLRIR